MAGYLAGGAPPAKGSRSMLCCLLQGVCFMLPWMLLTLHEFYMFTACENSEDLLAPLPSGALRERLRSQIPALRASLRRRLQLRWDGGAPGRAGGQSGGEDGGGHDGVGASSQEAALREAAESATEDLIASVLELDFASTPGPPAEVPRPAAAPSPPKKAGAAAAAAAGSAKEGGGGGACEQGVWRLTLHSADKSGKKCNLKDPKGQPICHDGAVEVRSALDSCTRFRIQKVSSCSPQDLKCKEFNCAKKGVLRLETAAGELVDSGSADKMLTCANVKFRLAKAVFCPQGGDECKTIDNVQGPSEAPRAASATTAGKGPQGLGPAPASPDAGTKCARELPTPFKARLPLNSSEWPLGARPATAAGATSGAKVPSVVHFVFGYIPDAAARVFTFVNYAAVLSALHVLRPERVLFHCLHEPEGLFWDLVKPFVTLVAGRDVHKIWGIPVEHYAHKADIVRLEALLDYGGIYLDIDLITLRPFDKLMNAECTLGEEGKGASAMGLCNGVILAARNATFLRTWYDRYHSFSNEKRKWNYHSVTLPKEIAKAQPELVSVQPFDAFHWPLWDAPGIKLMLDSFDYDYANNRAVHVWKHGVERSPQKDFNLAWCFECHSTLVSMLRSYVPDPLFSVVVPCMKREASTEDALRSVFAQKIPNWEVVVVDDQSPDHCGTAAHAWAEQHLDKRQLPRLRVLVSDRVVGEAEARNLGLKEARGLWVVSLSSGVSLGPELFHHAAVEMSRHPTVQLFYSDEASPSGGPARSIPDFNDATAAAAISIGGGVPRGAAAAAAAGVAPLDYAEASELVAVALGPAPGTPLLLRSLWAAAGGYSLVFPWGGEDHDFWLKLLGAGLKHMKLPGRHILRRAPAAAAAATAAGGKGSAGSAAAAAAAASAAKRSREERAMLETRHPLLYHPAHVLEAHKEVGAMSEETRQQLLRFEEAGSGVGVEAREEHLFAAFWLALSDLASGSPSAAERRLLGAPGLLQAAAAAASPPPASSPKAAAAAATAAAAALRWQPRLLLARCFCSRGDLSGAGRIFSELAAAYPELTQTQAFHTLEGACRGSARWLAAVPAHDGSAADSGGRGSGSGGADHQGARPPPVSLV